MTRRPWLVYQKKTVIAPDETRRAKAQMTATNTTILYRQNAISPRAFNFFLKYDDNKIRRTHLAKALNLRKGSGGNRERSAEGNIKGLFAPQNFARIVCSHKVVAARNNRNQYRAVTVASARSVRCVALVSTSGVCCVAAKNKIQKKPHRIVIITVTNSERFTFPP